MAWQLIYTSAARLLDAGRSGFGTVARHRQMSALLAAAVERVSQFNRASGLSDSRIIYSHRHINVAGLRYSVLSRIRSAGADYTGRSNHIAHHIIIDQREITAMGSNGPTPVDVLLSASVNWRDRWDEPPRQLGSEQEISINTIPRLGTLPAQWWDALAGNKRRAALLTSPEAARGCYLGWKHDLEQDALQQWPLHLFGESLLLRPDRAWDTTFTTNLQPSDEPADFHWRGMFTDSPLRPQAEQSGRSVFDLTSPSSLDMPTGELANLAELGVRKVTPQHFAVQQAPLPAPHEEYPQASSQAAEPRYEAPSRPQTAGPKPRQQPKQDRQELQKPSKWRALLVPGLTITATILIFAVYTFWSHKKQQEMRDEMVGNLALILEGLPPFKDATPSIDATKLTRQLLDRNEAIRIEELDAFCKNTQTLRGIWEKSQSGLNEDDAAAQQAINGFHKRGNVKPADRMDRWVELLAARLKVCAALKDKDLAAKYLRDHSRDQADKLETFAQDFTTVSEAGSKEPIPEADIGKVKAAITNLDEEKFELPANLKKVKEVLFTQKLELSDAGSMHPAKPQPTPAPVPLPTPSATPPPAPVAEPLFPCRTYIVYQNEQVCVPVEDAPGLILKLCKDLDRKHASELKKGDKGEGRYCYSLGNNGNPVLDVDPNSKKLVARKDEVKQLPGSYLLLASVGDAEKFQLYVANQPADANPKPLLPDVKNAFSQDGANGVYTLKVNHVSALQNWVPVGSQKLKIVIPQNVLPQNTISFEFSDYRLDFSRATAAMRKELAGCEAGKSERTQKIEQMQRLIGQAKDISKVTLPVFGTKLLGNAIKPEDPLFKFDPASKEAQKNIYGAFHEYLGHLLQMVKKGAGDDDNSSIFASNDSDGLDRYAASVEKDLKRMREKCEKLSKEATEKKQKDAPQQKQKLAFITQVQSDWKSLTDLLPLSKLSSVVDPNRFEQQQNTEIQRLTKDVHALDARMVSLRNHPFVKGKLPQGTYTVRVEEPGIYSIPLVNFIQTEDPE